MYESPFYFNESNYELDIEECIKVIDDYANALKNWGVNGRINFTGGDPLLKKDLFVLIKMAVKKGIEIGIMGNPDPNVVSYKVLRELKKLGVRSYQVSIDGLEKTHNGLRGKENAFKSAVKVIRMLNRVGLRSAVMFTLSRINMNELIPVIRLVAKERASVFDFARLVPIGSGRSMRSNMLAPLEYRELLLNVLHEYWKLRDHGIKPYFGRKEHLWKPLLKELGLLTSLPDDGLIHGGCGVGINILTILADGTVLPCRRLPVPIGKIPEENIRDIFINSKKLNELRQIEKIEGCKGCELLNFCRGCMGVSYGVYGDCFRKDPQCWKE